MDLQQTIRSQYHASLEMFKQTVVKCPEAMWDDSRHRNRTWLLAYHALYYTHLYLGPAEADFTPWPGHRDNIHRMGSPEHQSGTEAAYSQAEILAYVDYFQDKIDEMVDSLDLASDQSGFHWLPFNKLELQFYNIRHLQQHTGELSERLGQEAGLDIDWVGMKREGGA